MKTVPRAQLMRWFTSEWHRGELTDEAHEHALRDYQEHLAALVSSRSEACNLVALNLHDGQVQQWELDKGRFHWCLLTGDQQVGYEFVDVTYDDAELVGVEVAELTASRIDRRSVDLVSDELDETPAGNLEHRFYFWEGPVFGIRFANASVIRRPAHDIRR